MVSLLLRNLFFTILQPGLVAGLFPYWLLRGEKKAFIPDAWGLWQYAGLPVMVIGFSIMTACILRFATEGRGTLSPIDPTKKLVVGGLYKYTRNPMYLGVILLLIGESVFWESLRLAGYAGVVFAGFNLFILLHEEPRLRRDFPAEYDAYCQKVRRWL